MAMWNNQRVNISDFYDGFLIQVQVRKKHVFSLLPWLVASGVFHAYDWDGLYPPENEDVTSYNPPEDGFHMNFPGNMV
jgi:hypothetical protein